jgi:low affinity Fe/Cu permease
MKRRVWYSHFTRWAAGASGRPTTFLGAALLTLISGAICEFSEQWQVIIQTITAIITFLMVFVIQNTQNRDTEAMQIKLDELIRTAHGAHLVLLDLEELDSKELDKFRARYEKLASEARRDLDRGRPDTDTRPV